MQHFDGYRLGATLYMPIIHPNVVSSVHPLNRLSSSMVLCLEDALHENDVERGVAVLQDLLSRLERPADHVFVRPRTLEMAHRLAGFKDIEKICGFVAPKVRVETIEDWLTLVASRNLKIMPTLEGGEFFDPARIVAFRDVLQSRGQHSIAAVRVGGNDLLGSLGLRRERGITSWEGPLANTLSYMSTVFGSSQIPVAAPVFDVIDDLETLQREVERDVAAGFVSKTAIHPVQVPVIEEGFKVRQDEFDQASAILNDRAAAVFRIGGVMCEPSTHRNWALRIQARASIFGVKEADINIKEQRFG